MYPSEEVPLRQKSIGFIPFYENPEEEKIEFLLIRSAHNRQWYFPRGRAEEEDEDQLATANREFFEETGGAAPKIQVGFREKLYYPIIINSGRRIRREIIYYLARVEEKFAVKLSEEHDAYRWTDYKGAKKLLKGNILSDLLDMAMEFLLGQEKQEN